MLSPTSERAQVSVQDVGSYTLFKEIKGGLWTAFNDGLGREGAGCPQDLPASILAMWLEPAVVQTPRLTTRAPMLALIRQSSSPITPSAFVAREPLC
jgi:hypothetical protein